jgi:hypothetical protein
LVGTKLIAIHEYISTVIPVGIKAGVTNLSLAIDQTLSETDYFCCNFTVLVFFRIAYYLAGISNFSAKAEATVVNVRLKRK